MNMDFEEKPSQQLNALANFCRSSLLPRMMSYPQGREHLPSTDTLCTYVIDHERLANYKKAYAVSNPFLMERTECGRNQSYSYS